MCYELVCLLPCISHFSTYTPTPAHGDYSLSSLSYTPRLQLLIFPQAEVGLVLASTNPGPHHLRGKLSGLFMTVQSLGGVIGPACWATAYAWSISPVGRVVPLVNHSFVFICTGVLMAVFGALGWICLTPETMTTIAGEEEGEEHEEEYLRDVRGIALKSPIVRPNSPFMPDNEDKSSSLRSLSISMESSRSFV